MEKTLSNKKDPGKLTLANETFEGIAFKRCVLSMTGAMSRSRFDGCRFKDVRGDECTIGHAIFNKCDFEDITATDTITLYDAMFLECRFAGKLTNLNFGNVRATSPFFSEDRYQADISAMEKSPFSLDISSVTDMDECAFIGDVLARKIRFRAKQGFILKGKRLDLALEQTLKTTEDFGLAIVLATPVAFGSLFDLHFCGIPTNLAHKADDYASIIRGLGVEVIEEPFC